MSIRDIRAGKGWIGLMVILLALGLAACSKGTPEVQRTPVVIQLPTAAMVQQAENQQAPAASGAAADTPMPVPTATLAPAAPLDPNVTPEPPVTFQTDKLLKVVKPVTYIDDTCKYLRMRWDPDNAAPGTIIVPVMYHRIRHPGDSKGLDRAYFRQTMRTAKKLGYQTITTEQAADFLEHNAKIPPRSLLLFVDDRRVNVIMNDFMPWLEKYDWNVVSAWIIANSDKIPHLWERIEAAYKTGRVDVQSHGLRHLYIIPSTPKKKIKEEIYGPIPYFEKHFGYRPIAFIWPGGNFTRYAVRVARQAGYRVGFTVYQNGPVMFNWVPLRKEDGAVGDPLLVLPRYRPNLIKGELPIAAEIGDQARKEALDHYPQEAAWYRQHCGGELPPPSFGE